VPAQDDVRRVLVAAADVIFSDGVSKAFLDHWTAETLLLLSIRETSSLERSGSRHTSFDIHPVGFGRPPEAR
jgi:hypothetical protein